MHQERRKRQYRYFKHILHKKIEKLLIKEKKMNVSYFWIRKKDPHVKSMVDQHTNIDFEIDFYLNAIQNVGRERNRH